MNTLAQRFRGFYPVVVDVETGGFNADTDALLEIAAVVIEIDEAGILSAGECHGFHIHPFEGANLEQAALAFNKIDPYHPFRFAVSEKEALTSLFDIIRKKIHHYQCRRAVLVGHNPAFDLSFLKAAAVRQHLKRNPFHLFTTFDTATLGALAYGQTVLARAVDAAGIAFDASQAHSAIYDAKTTAELFCRIVNHWQTLGGWVDLSTKG